MTKQQPQIKVHHILLPASQLATLLSQQQICTTNILTLTKWQSY